MNHFQLTSFLNTNVDFDKNFMQIILSKTKEVTYKKGAFLLSEGETCSHFFFVEKGLLRYYSIDSKGKEHILQFASENWFVSDRESVFFNKPSQYYIQALEDSEVILIDEDFINQLSKENISFVEFNNHLLHNHIKNLQRRITQLLSATAEERYLDFIKLYPDILLRVPQWMVASYLGITPESLSRIRKDLVNNYK